MDLTQLNKDRSKTRRNRSVDLNTMVYGKVPPQAKDLEEAVLGAIMLDKPAFDIVCSLLTPETFYVDAHQRIYKAMKELAQKSQPIDILTVVQQLKYTEELEMVGGPYYITRLTNGVCNSANIEAHARIIVQQFIKREMIRMAGILISDAYEESTDCFEILEQAETIIANISHQITPGSHVPMDVALVNVIQKVEMLRNHDDHIIGIPAGFDCLDSILHGWRDTDLTIIAARPSVGKTAFALALARNAALHPTRGVPVGIFSLEMGIEQLVMRMLSSESGLSLESITTGRLEEGQMKQLYVHGIQALAHAPIFIDDTAALNIFELRAKIRRLVNKHGVRIIFVDYLQLMSGTGERRNGNREQEISQISRELKAAAKEYKIPIIALSQLSREVERRKDGNKMPQLSDLRESGAIEQDADNVLFLYRPEYYDITANEMGESNRGETHIKIAKHRNGALDIVKLRAELWRQRFYEWEGDLFDQPASASSSTASTGSRQTFQGGWKRFDGPGDNGRDDDDIFNDYLHKK